MISPTTSAGAATSPLSNAAPRSRSEGGTQLSRFAVVGVTCVLIDLAAYSALAALAVPTGAAKAAGYLAGMAFGFFLNKRWTFRSTRRSASEPALYVSLYTLTLGVNVLANAAVLSLLGPDWRGTAFVLATGLTTVLNFLGLKLVAFRAGVRARLDAGGAGP